jgi:hypothetical protein
MLFQLYVLKKKTKYFFLSGGGGGGGSGCFNCGKDGHRSFECPEPRKGGGGGRSGGGERSSELFHI